MRGIPQPRVFWHARKPFVNSTLKKPFGRVLYTTINVDRRLVYSLSWLLAASQSAAGWCSRPIGQFTLTRPADLQRCRCPVLWSVALSSMPMARVQDTNAAWRPVDVPASGRHVHAGSGCPPNCHPSSASDQCSAAFISAASQTTHASS